MILVRHFAAQQVLRVTDLFHSFSNTMLHFSLAAEPECHVNEREGS